MSNGQVIQRRVNRGGTIAIADIVGRDDLIARLWRILEVQSIVLGAERRIGKSTVVRKMEADPRPGFLVINRNVEDIKNPADFVDHLWQDVAKYLPKHLQAGGFLRKLAGSFSGAEFKGVKLPNIPAAQWKPLLERTLAALAADSEPRIVFIWDEMPTMLERFHREDERNGETTARELLDTLRHLRQTHPRLRMVYTGSIGLHHTLTALQRAGYTAAPTNDMLPVHVPAIASEDARALALSLLLGELQGRIALPDIDGISRCIAEEANNIPFFVHQIVGSLADQIDTLTQLEEKDVLDVVVDCLRSADDPWKLRHYRQRIGWHYTSGSQPLAIALLDSLAISDSPLTFADLFNRLKTQLATEDEEAAREVLTLLLQDYYLEQERTGAYRFRFSIIARSWRFQRGL